MRVPAAGSVGSGRAPEPEGPKHAVFVAGASGCAAAHAEESEADTAVIVCHGMGQQVRFETLQMVIKAVQDRGGLGTVDATVDVSPEVPGRADGPTLPVAIASWKEAGVSRNAHFFECYWAPLIEGKVGVWDVFSFLCKAGIRGIRFAWTGAFTRRLFNKDRKFRLGGSFTRAQLGMALLLVLALGCLGPTFLVTTVARALHNFGFAVPRGDGLFRGLEADLLLFSRLILALAFPFLVQAAWDAFSRGKGKPLASQACVWAAAASLYFFLILYELPWQAVVAAAGYFYLGLLCYSACRDARIHPSQGKIGPVAILLWSHLCAMWILLVAMGAFCLWSWTHFWNVHDVSKAVPWMAGQHWLPDGIRACLLSLAGLPERAALAIPGYFARDWGLLHKPFLILHAAAGLGLIAGARFFLIEYAGDVAAYVSSHSVDRFYEVREQIQEACLRVAAHVYGAKRGDRHRYQRVIVVGHSLGSVLAYDTLNRMILRDRFANGALQVAARTPLLLTFGSPLDKTAFLFRTQLQGADVREGLAEARQPMISNPVHRPRRWINIWSRNDIVSGPLQFYDTPEDDGDPDACPVGKRVRNIEDTDATMPLGAHTQYWTNPLLAEILAHGLKGTL